MRWIFMQHVYNMYEWCGYYISMLDEMENDVVKECVYVFWVGVGDSKWCRVLRMTTVTLSLSLSHTFCTHFLCLGIMLGWVERGVVKCKMLYPNFASFTWPIRSSLWEHMEGVMLYHQSDGHIMCKRHTTYTHTHQIEQTKWYGEFLGQPLDAFRLKRVTFFIRPSVNFGMYRSWGLGAEHQGRSDDNDLIKCTVWLWIVNVLSKPWVCAGISYTIILKI